jgi:hypothetical protein
MNYKNAYGKYNKKYYNRELNLQKQKFKQEYLETKLTQDDKKLINLYEDQQINLKISQYAFGVYIIIPLIVLVSINIP